MKKLPTMLLLSAGLVLALPATEEPSVSDLKKELARTKAELAVLKAEADLTRKKQELQNLIDGKTGETPAAEGPKPAEPKPDKPPKKTASTATSGYVEKMPDFAWRSVAKNGSDLFILGGTRVLAPYEIDLATKKLSTGKNRLGGYLEVFFANTWAWQPDDAAASIAYGQAGLESKVNEAQWTDRWVKRGSGYLLESDSDAVLVNPFSTDLDDTGDFSARFSFEFANGATASPTTVTGSGDFSAEIAANKHLLQGYSNNSLYTLGLGGSIGASTDRVARRIHPRLFAGLIGNLSRVITVDKDGTNRLALIHFGLGWAEIETVQFDPADSTKSTLIFDGEAPRYRRHRGPAAEAELFYPVNKASYVTVNARFYGKTDPTPWALSIGYTIDPMGALKGFFPDSNASEPAAAKEKK